MAAVCHLRLRISGWSPDPEEALRKSVALARRAVEYPSYPIALRPLACCRAHLGRLEEARAIIEQLRAVTPDILTPYLAMFRRPEDRELITTGMRLAMRGEP